MAQRRMLSRPASDIARRRAAKVMLAVSAVGVVVAILGTVTAWIVLGQLNESTRDTVDVSIESLDAIDNTLALTDEVLASTIETVDAMESTLDAVGNSVATGSEVVDSVRDLSASAGPAIAEAESTLRDLEEIGGTIDDVLDTVSSLPFGPDYAPTARFGETLGQLADDLNPLESAFDETTASLQGFSGSSGELQAEVEALAQSVGQINESLRQSPALVDQYDANISNARGVAENTRKELADNLRLARVLILLLGATLAVGQLVPFWYGRELLSAGSEPQERSSSNLL